MKKNKNIVLEEENSTSFLPYREIINDGEISSHLKIKQTQHKKRGDFYKKMNKKKKKHIKRSMDNYAELYNEDSKIPANKVPKGWLIDSWQERKGDE